MHGTFKDIQNKTNAISAGFDAFIASLYTSGVVPPVIVLDELPQDEQAFITRTGGVAVLSEDEDLDCPVFGNWGTYYEFIGWMNYRSRQGNPFQLMVSDLLATTEWSSEVKHWIDIINGLVVVQELYFDKFRHYPVNLNKFIKSYIGYGSDTVLRADLY